MNYLIAVTNCFLDRPSGSARVAWDIARVAREAGWRVGLLCSSRPSADDVPDVEELEGVRVVRFRVPQLPLWHPMRGRRHVAAAAEACRRNLSDVSWDLVHIHTPMPGCGAIDAFGRNARYLCTAHSPVVLEQEINWRQQGLSGRMKLLLGRRALAAFEERTLRHASLIHTLSQFTKLQLAEMYGLAERIRVIPHWRRPELRRTHERPEARRLLGWDNSTPVFFSLRRHVHRMGLDTAIRAAAPLVKAGRCRLILAGDGPDRLKLQALARALDVEIEFPGRISDQELALSYEAADLFLLPTRSLECFGLITQEALSFGCPVLATDAGAILEMMTPILPDFIVPAGDADAMREKMRAFLDRDLVPPSPEKMIDYVDSYYGRDIVVPKIIQLLEDAART